MVDAGLPSGADIRALSDNGQVIVGTFSDAQGRRAMRWTAAGGVQILPPLPGIASAYQATGVSADGSVVIGYRETDDLGYYWTEQTGTVALPLPTGAQRSVPLGISADGTTIVGQAYHGTFNKGVIWKTDGSFMELPDLGGLNAYATAVSGDGSVVVGRTDRVNMFASPASMWDAVHGTRSIANVLTGLGVNLDGWQLYEATDISTDGLTIIGYGENPQGFEEGWIATVPEPSSFILAAAALVALAAFARRVPVFRSA